MYFLSEDGKSLVSNERAIRDIVIVWDGKGDNYYIALQGKEGTRLFSGTGAECKAELERITLRPMPILGRTL